MGQARRLSALLVASLPNVALGGAGHPVVRLVLEDDAGCTTPGALGEAVAARLGYLLFQDSADLVVRLKVRRVEAGLEGGVSLESSTGRKLGQRALKVAPTCADLEAGATFAIALAVDPLAGDPRPDPTSPAAAPPAGAQPPTSPAPQVPSNQTASGTVAAHQPPAGPTFSAELGLLVSVASAPSPVPGLTAGAHLAWDRWSVGLEGRLDLPGGRALPGGGRVEVGLLEATLVSCLRLATMWRACGLVSAGGLRVRGEDLPRARNGTAAYASTGLRVGYVVHLGPRWALALGPEVHAVLTRVALVDGDGEGAATYWATPVIHGALRASAVFEIE